jgi:group I intron endonuclease
MIGIYKITSPSGKIYIGKSINIEDRINSYKYVGRRKLQHKLNNSINKYGLENHIFEIIEICTLDNIDEREIYWIKHYNCVEIGLNLTYGGEGGIPSQEVRIKKSRSMKGKTHSEETKNKMRLAKQGHTMYTQEWYNNMKKSTWSSGTSSKPVQQLDSNGNVINEFKSITDAKKALNVKSTSINNVLIGISKTAHGYKWKFK